jgi:hypothetical protein
VGFRDSVELAISNATCTIREESSPWAKPTFESDGMAPRCCSSCRETGRRAIVHPETSTCNRNRYLDESTGIGIAHSKETAEFHGALPHPSETDSYVVWPQLHNLSRNSFAVVTNHDHDAAFFATQDYPTFACTGMSENVSQTFLHDSEDCRLQLRGQPGKVVRLHFQ